MLEEPLYHEALCRLDYIEKVKQSIGELLHQMTSNAHSTVAVKADDYQHALACIYEVIDDMFYEEKRQAQKVKEDFIRENRQAWLRELQKNT